MTEYRFHTRDDDQEMETRKAPEKGPPNMALRKPLTRRNLKKDPDIQDNRREQERDRYSAYLGDYYYMSPTYVSPVYRTMMALPSDMDPDVPDLDPLIESDISALPATNAPEEEVFEEEEYIKQFNDEERLPSGVNPDIFWEFLVYNPRRASRYFESASNKKLLKRNSVNLIDHNRRSSTMSTVRLSSSKAEVGDLLRIVQSSGGRIRTSRAARELERMGYSSRVARSIISDTMKVADLSEEAGWLNITPTEVMNNAPYLSPKDIEGPDPDAMWYNAAQQYAHDLTFTRKSRREARRRALARRAARRRQAIAPVPADQLPEATSMLYGGGRMKSPVADRVPEVNIDRDDYEYMNYFDRSSTDYLPPEMNVHTYGEDLQANKWSEMTPLASRQARREARRRANARRMARRQRYADLADSYSTASPDNLVPDDYALSKSDMPTPDSVQEVARDLARRNGALRKARARRLNRRR